MRSFGEWMFDSFNENPVRTVATPREASAETRGIAPPERTSRGPYPQHVFERVERELQGGSVGGDETRRSG